MAVLVLCRDLLFGSKLEGALTIAGYDVRRWDQLAAVRATVEPGDTLVVDLTDPDLDGASAIESMRANGELEGVATLGFYAHVDQETRRRAEDAGFDRVVPRSRLAREAPALMEALSE